MNEYQNEPLKAEWSTPSNLTTQANIRSAKILAYLHRPKTKVSSSSANILGSEQTTSQREKEWSELCESWEHSRDWWVVYAKLATFIFSYDIFRIEHLMTTSKLVENTSVPEISKSEHHRGKEVSKKEDLTASRRCDETWVPGRGMQITIISQCWTMWSCKFQIAGWVSVRGDSVPEGSTSRSLKPAKAKDIESRLSDRINFYRWSPEKIRDLGKRVSLYRDAKKRQRNVSVVKGQ